MLTMATLPGKEWPADLYTHQDCLSLDPSKDYGEDFMDLFAGCVLGALEQDDIKLARAIFEQSNATAEQKMSVRSWIVKNVGEAVAEKVAPKSSAWYRDWRVLAAIGAAVAIPVVAIAVKRRKKRS